MAELKFPYDIIPDRYKIIKKIASGGTSDIFLAEDLKLEKKVALKILYSSYASDRNFVARFKSEAQILNKLDDPGIIKVYDWGSFNSSYYISMEYVEGKSLKDIIEQKGPLNPVTAAKIAMQICEVLDVAHRNNLIHRDIKPQNILITREGKVKVTDFGIAKSLNTDQTMTMNIVGTAHYLSPEQAQGRVLDNRTDIYSLGIVLYEMLTADVPFRGENYVDISLKHINEKPLKPSFLIRNIPEKLDSIVLHCLEKNPLNRYPDIKRLKDDFKNFIEGRPLNLSKEPDTLKSGRFAHKFVMPKTPIIYALAASSLLAAIFLALFLIYSFKYYDSNNTEDDIVSVPPIENIDADQAKEILDLLGFELIVTDSKNSEYIPENLILSQEPSSDSSMPAGGAVNVVLSLGPEENFEFNMPNIVGLEVGQGTEILNSLGVGDLEITEQYSDFFKTGTIISQKPLYGSAMNSNDDNKVTLTVSRGSETIVIPNIIGLDYPGARNYLISLGLAIIVSRIPVDNDPAGTPGVVVGSNPEPGKVVSKGDIIEIYISSLDNLIKVPAVTNMGFQQSGQILNSLGLNFEISYVKTDYAVQDNVVLSQVPEEGRFISPGESVILFVGRQ